jgi:hypothetical protein
MRRQLLQTLVVASLATMAFNAGAQNATPRELPPGSDSVVQPQNGTPATTPPSNVYQPGPSGYSLYSPYSPDTQQRMTSDQIRQYMDARRTCISEPIAAQENCNNEVNQQFGSIDAKCQKLMGPALADCLRGADHGE